MGYYKKLNILDYGISITGKQAATSTSDKQFQLLGNSWRHLLAYTTSCHVDTIKKFQQATKTRLYNIADIADIVNVIHST